MKTKPSWTKIVLATPWLAGVAVGLFLASGIYAMFAATALAGRAHPRTACNDVPEGGIKGPIALKAPPDPGVISMFGVLRRPAGSEDSLQFKKAFKEVLAFQLRSYYPNFVRLLVKEHGERYFLVLGFRRGFSIPPARCVPKDIQSIRPRLVAEQQKREHELVYCIVNPADESYEGINCQSLSELERGEQFVTFAVSKAEHIDLIPDGIATVRLSYIDGTVLSTPIMNENVLRFTTPQDVLKQARAKESKAEKAFKILRRGHLDKRQRMRAEHDFAELAKRIRLELTPKTVEWYDSAGHLIKTMSPPALGGRQILVITFKVK